MALWKEFKEFALKGNVVDLAVGVIIGLYFGAIVKSLVDDVVMPILGLLTGGIDLTTRYYVVKTGHTGLAGNETLPQARATGAVVIGYGAFLNTILTFLIVSFVIFLAVKQMNRLRHREKKGKPADPTEKNCPFCFTKIAVKASRCPACTSQLGPSGEPSTPISGA